MIDYQLIYYELLNKIKHLAYIMPIFAYIFIIWGARMIVGMVFALGRHAPCGGIRYVYTQKYTD